MADKTKENEQNPFESESDDEDIAGEFEDISKAITTQVRDKVANKIANVKGRIRKLKTNLATAKFVRLRDKIAFFFGQNWLVFTFFCVGAVPCYFHLFYAFFFVLLVAIRFVIYRTKRQHYFLLEFCYWANVWTILYTFVYSDNKKIFQGVFAIALGPLAWSPICLGNAMVPHSIDRITSTYIHVMPPLVMWCLKWRCPDFALYGEQEFSFLEMTSMAFVIYIVWAIVYSIKIFSPTGKTRVERLGLDSTYTWLAANPSSVGYRISGAYGERFRPLIYMLLHFCYLAITSCFAYFALYNEVVHLAIMLLNGWMCFWNGANYYMEYFSKNNENRLSNLEKLNQVTDQS